MADVQKKKLDQHLEEVLLRVLNENERSPQNKGVKRIMEQRSSVMKQDN